MDRSLLEFRWLRRLLAATALLWVLWLFCAAVYYFGYNNQSGLHVYYPFYIFFVVIIIWTAMAAFLKPQAAILPQTVSPAKQPVPAELRAKGAWLKRGMEANLYYQDPELSLSSLAEKLSMPPHELSKAINTVFKKSFNDFINEYRVMDAVRKMQDPAYDHITLLGIAYDAGFNSKRTFNRVFKEMTGKTPVEFKNSLKNEGPIDKLALLPRTYPVILRLGSPPIWAVSTLKRTTMFKNYFKLAYRNVVRDKAYSIINIAGLTIGLAASILILLWVQNELGYDKFHKNAGQIYRVVSDFGESKMSANSAGMPAGLKAELPMVKNTVRIQPADPILFEAGSKKFQEEHVFYADESFLDVFSYPLIKGNPANALKQPGAILITQQMAVKYFGNEDPIGKMIRKDNQENVEVTGVLANIPANSDLQFDFILPMTSLARTNSDLKNDVWDNFNFWDYIQLDKSFDPSTGHLSDLEKQIDGIFQKHSTAKAQFHLQRLTDIHLADERLSDMAGHGNVQYVRIFFVIAILIIVVACINFMNLATARSARRAKEIGLRKVAGAVRGQLVLQFLSESVLISFLALVLAIIAVRLFLPVFNELANRKLTLNFLNGQLWLGLIGIALFTGLISGSYPAIFLSGFNPVKVLKGNVKSMGGNLLFRNTLVVIQFTVSIVLLAGTVVIYNQLKFIKERNPGFEKANLLYLSMTGDLWGRQQALKNELSQNPLTSDYAVTSQLPTEVGDWTLSVGWAGKDPHSQMSFPIMIVNENFIRTFRMHMLAGRSFSSEFKSDSGNYMINETMARTMGLHASTAVGKPLTVWGNPGIIVGVVKDFNYKPIHQAIEPLVMPFNKNGGFVVVRTILGKTTATIAALAGISKNLNPAYPFAFNFLDQDLDNLYKGEQQMGSIFNLFAILGILISCLGLYGLSAFVAEQRTKEIGVRKVLGASVLNLVYLLSSGITKLILIAIMVAIPLSWYAVNSWLSGFAYHIQVSWLVFATASFAALAVAWITVSYESIKAAVVNPIKSLRTE